MVPCSTLDGVRDGGYVWLAGLIPVRQRPGSAKGVMFITIDDETGIANLIVWPRMFEENRRLVMGARLLGIYGQVQREGEAVHVIVKKLVNLSDILDTLTQRDGSFRLALGRADGAMSGGGPDRGGGKCQLPNS
ncbi:OB-fold nucleic acid binding domain-containing protein [Sphingopyxis sp. DBS4]|uniref:OB-fold nucleic acid binding domain-containing protein n=1 Tax=Sphingopyxis sp. DBS4 TaxID=2968500 RepID=UPI00214ABA21|nr:OB-fold nucleic acid binding domain-containing protein [Sphingopyxis sp. DBS4]